MAARYQRWLVAKGGVFSPSSAGVAKLITRLRKESWLPEGGGASFRTVEVDGGILREEQLPPIVGADWLDHPSREEVRLVWPVTGHEGLRYPLARKPDGAAPYALEIHRSADYVVPTARTVGTLPSRCACGDDLAFAWDEDEVIPAFEDSTGIFAECEACSRTFDPTKGAALIANPFDGSSIEVRAGAAYRFALKVDCGESFVRDAALAFAPELAPLLEEEFGREFWQLASLG